MQQLSTEQTSVSNEQPPQIKRRLAKILSILAEAAIDDQPTDHHLDVVAPLTIYQMAYRPPA